MIKDEYRITVRTGETDMLNIYADMMMTATRNKDQTGCMRVRDVPPANPRPKRRWLPEGHWFVAPERCVDPSKF